METDYQDYATSSDYCIHGTYLGSWAGPDYMCGACEAGADHAVSYPIWDVETIIAELPSGKTLHKFTSSTCLSVEDARIAMKERAHSWCDSMKKTAYPIIEDDDNLIQMDNETGEVRLTIVVTSASGGGWVDERTLREMRDEGRDFTVTYPKGYEFDEEDEG